MVDCHPAVLLSSPPAVIHLGKVVQGEDISLGVAMTGHLLPLSSYSWLLVGWDGEGGE